MQLDLCKGPRTHLQPLGCTEQGQQTPPAPAVCSVPLQLPWVTSLHPKQRLLLASLAGAFPRGTAPAIPAVVRVAGTAECGGVVFHRQGSVCPGDTGQQASAGHNRLEPRGFAAVSCGLISWRWEEQ